MEEKRPVNVELQPVAVRVEAQPVRVGMRVYFSTYQLWAARHLAAEAHAIERAHDPASDRPRFDIQLRANVMMSVIASATFVESFVNEVCEDLIEGYGPDGRYDSIPEHTRPVMAQYWESRGERDSTLGKYQMLLVACDRPALDQGQAPYQDARLLFKLRNELIHYRPETLYANDDHRLQQQLRTKFDDCRLLTGAGNPWWPDHCLGFGCAEWAVTSALALVDHVADALDIAVNYRQVDFGNPLDSP